MSWANRFDRLRKEIATNPRKCDYCGCVETMHNIIIKYDKGYICDDCLPIAYPDECGEGDEEKD